MRADRLISLLMLLQARGKMTAHALAQELEVSERTIYRDVDALSAAGVPVYGDAGPSGGYALLDSYRTNLTGMTDKELHALFMLNVPGPLVQIGLGHELGAALLKLSAALPESRRVAERHVKERFYLDPVWWQPVEEQTTRLQVAYEAVCSDRRLEIRYQPMPTVDLERVVDPLGLVAKAGVWYLICAAAGQVHVHRVVDLLDARLTDEPGDRPAGFDLAAFWEEWRRRYEASHQSYRVRLKVGGGSVPFISARLGLRVGTPPPVDAAQGQDEVELEISFASLDEARDRLLALGNAVEVVGPQALRRSMEDYARQVLSRYAPLSPA